jgi:hypothetical protein
LALVERLESLARRPPLRFFHCEIEFPEVFFTFADADERHLKHKDAVRGGSVTWALRGFQTGGRDKRQGASNGVQGDRGFIALNARLYHACDDREAGWRLHNDK